MSGAGERELSHEQPFDRRSSVAPRRTRDRPESRSEAMMDYAGVAGVVRQLGPLGYFWPIAREYF